MNYTRLVLLVSVVALVSTSEVIKLFAHRPTHSSAGVGRTCAPPSLATSGAHRRFGEKEIAFIPSALNFPIFRQGGIGWMDE